jgi:CheY-like chemotaxis protein
MATILLLDESEVAGRAMQGILARGDHACVIATTAEEAWKILREGIVVDLVFVELKLAKGDGIALLQRIRDDWFWKNLPIVVYTYDTDAKQVRKALALRVQNYLVKPYNDQLVHAEIAKAQANPWRNLHFEEPKSFCAQMGLTPDALAKMRKQVMTSYEEAAKIFPLWGEERENTEVFARIDALTADAEGAGVWAGVDFLAELRAQAERDNWAYFLNAGEPFDFAARLIFCHLAPAYMPEILCTEKQKEEMREAADKARWAHLDVDQNGPVVDAAELEKQLGALSGCPVIDTEAANFQMAADGNRASMSHVLELVSCDPGLCTLVLAAANKAGEDDLALIEDPRAAATMLGEIKLNAMAKVVPIAHERHMNLPPLTWTSYWMFLVGVSKVSQFISNYLDLTYLSGTTATAGLMHDIGRLVLLKLHPFGLQAMVRYAADRKVPLREAERKHLTWTSRDLGLRFAELQGLPRVYQNVIRYVEQPALATEHADIVAMVSLARHVCLHNKVGYCGDAVGDTPIAKTPAWQVLQPRLFPSFDEKKFEQQAHAYCVELRKELTGGAGNARANAVRAVA